MDWTKFLNKFVIVSMRDGSYTKGVLADVSEHFLEIRSSNNTRVISLQDIVSVRFADARNGSPVTST
jgi:small nuclear ribonucleoprotein (snRNP)-like protein